MNNLNELLLDSDESWIDCLPVYQKNRINELLSSDKSIDDVASIWLSASPQNIAPFGTTKGEKIFVEKLKEELEGLLCGDNKYEEYRKKLLGEVNLTKGYAIGVISSAIAPIVGSSGTFIAPVIALLLVGMGKVTVNAWCECRKEKRKEIIE